jgi:hypothetical protein
LFEAEDVRKLSIEDLTAPGDGDAEAKDAELLEVEREIEAMRIAEKENEALRAANVLAEDDKERSDGESMLWLCLILFLIRLVCCT